MIIRIRKEKGDFTSLEEFKNWMDRTFIGGFINEEIVCRFEAGKKFGNDKDFILFNDQSDFFIYNLIKFETDPDDNIDLGPAFISDRIIIESYNKILQFGGFNFNKLMFQMKDEQGIIIYRPLGQESGELAVTNNWIMVKDKNENVSNITNGFKDVPKFNYKNNRVIYLNDLESYKDCVDVINSFNECINISKRKNVIGTGLCDDLRKQSVIATGSTDIKKRRHYRNIS